LFSFLASGQPIDLASPTLTSTQVDWLKQRKFKINSANGIILTDNLNPLEHLQTRKSEHYRHVLVDWFGADLLVR
jgi:hypothetical protein